MTLYLCSNLSDLLLTKLSVLEAILVSIQALYVREPMNLYHQSSLKSLTFLGMTTDDTDLPVVCRTLKTLSQENTIQHLGVHHSTRGARPNGHDYSDFVMEAMPYLPKLVSLNISPRDSSSLGPKKPTVRYIRKHHSLNMKFLYEAAQKRHFIDKYVPYVELSWKKFCRNYESNIDEQHHLCGSILGGLALSNLPKCFEVLYATGFYSEFCDRDIILINSVEFSIEF